MLITLTIAYGIDYWLFLQKRVSLQNGNIAQAFIWEILGGLALSAIWLALSWVIIVKNRRNVAISVIFIIVGLLSFIWYPLEIISPYIANHLFIFRISVINLQYSGLFIAVLGFLALLIPKHTAA
jgi:hypothetical protein